ncbi:MAG TPA: hypothetical protein VND62_07415 [Acidimicrobiales bacterium]|nr:hypothetical protein [Acidimicrobiales bacterium]
MRFRFAAADIWVTPAGLTLTLAGYLNDYGIATFPTTYGGLVAGASFAISLTTVNPATEEAFR